MSNTGVDKTIKRAIPIKEIKVLKELDLSLKPSLDFARDMFMFSFYTRGMSFIDMAYLKKSDLQNGILTYHVERQGSNSPSNGRSAWRALSPNILRIKQIIFSLS